MAQHGTAPLAQGPNSTCAAEACLDCAFMVNKDPELKVYNLTVADLEAPASNNLNPAEAAQQEQLRALMFEALSLAKASVLVNLRFLDTAFSLLELRPTKQPHMLCDGRRLWLNPQQVLASYKQDPRQLARDYLHIVLHCVFQHPFFDKHVIANVWDLSCDIAVEATINELDLAATYAQRQERQRARIEDLRSQLGVLTAEKLYAYFNAQNLKGEVLAREHELFLADNHVLWYDFERANKTATASQAAEGAAPVQRADTKGQEYEAGTHSDQKNKDKGHKEKSSRAGKTLGQKEKPQEAREAIGPRHANTVGLDRSRDQWKNAAYQMGVELESFARLWGTEGGGLVAQLRRVNREKQSYADFLRKFALPREEIHINPDEFDYLFYCYGLELFGNVPLIEPLEYVNTKTVRDFVIAIDTSASTKDELVHKFFTKTYNILHEQESFSTKINIYIIQADATIQEVVRIGSKEEFDRYMQQVEIKGLGGTDFRPVFAYCDYLVDQGVFENFGGLIYFTDGQGTFPQKKPDYKAAFVFVDDDGFASNRVPAWAIQLRLESEQIEEFGDGV